MTDQINKSLSDEGLDQMLHSAFPATSPISKGFEDRVINEIGAIENKRPAHRKINLLMAVYWGIATTLAFFSVSTSVLTTAFIQGNFVECNQCTISLIAKIIASFSCSKNTKQNSKQN